MARTHIALLAATFTLITSAATAETVRDDRYFVAWGPSSARDVVRAVRCPAPVGCRKHRRARHHTRHRKPAAVPMPKPRPKSLARGAVEEVRKAVAGRARGLAGVTPVLAAKATEIVRACGSRVISGVRHTYIAGSRRISLHASGKAVDIAGSPACIYAHLKGWPGGYSVDYARVKHVHISYDPKGGREMHARFHHGGGHRYAKRHGRSMSARRHWRRHHRWRA